MEQSFVVVNPTGIHARPAKKIVEAAKLCGGTVFFEKDGKKVSAKSLVNVLALGAKLGDTVIVSAEGEQAEAAVEAIGAVFAAVEVH
ncbi:HPr family phosphocarrier protein [Paenibacillus lignilyticus]|uniref:HPr family phosphocarrier protein n=1 Tax=Paenibacillus lignilyticus TaxID=1172615 RepID=A0ABS5C654_9BACL|nr:HPr family phosphocarrier protein [Paenibacillus lignilyticus]MBP3961486.1 HPr family phosphocarrier protein [Paenibacillus lignilyticus]